MDAAGVSVFGDMHVDQSRNVTLGICSSIFV
jgi:hypothetical protein